MNQERHDIYTIKTFSSIRYNVTRDIILIGNTVYTCGDYHNGYEKIACFWVGSTKYNLQGSNYNSYANSMYYDGSKFYIAGSNTDSSFPCYYTAELNGDNTHYNLDTQWTGGFSEATDICVSGNTVYTVGYRGWSPYEAFFWKGNAIEQIIGFGSDYNYSTAKDYRAKAIFPTDEAVYIAGNNHNSAACYWKRDVNVSDTYAFFYETILCENGSANAVFVVQ